MVLSNSKFQVPESVLLTTRIVNGLGSSSLAPKSQRLYAFNNDWLG